jgi:hypothetical protein
VSILNRPSDGLLTVLLVLRRALIAYGPQPEGRLVALCAPPSAVDPDMARKTLFRWRQLGVFHERDGRIHLRPDLSAVETNDLDGLRRILLQLILMPDNNPEFVAMEAGRPPAEEGSLAADFTRAAAWTLAQDIYGFSGRWERMQTEQAINPLPFTNDTRWAGFVDWAAFLGIGCKHRGVLVLDPAFAVRSVLSAVFRGTRDLPQELFLQRLAEALPVIDGGRYRVAVEKQMMRPWRIFRQHEVSPSLSAALLHLEVSEELRLETRADAPQRTLTGRGGGEFRKFSHVVVTEEA